MNRRQFIGAGIIGGITTGLYISGQEKSSNSSTLKPQTIVKLAPRFGDGRDWWFEKRLGMFVHWGLYAIEG